MSEVILKVENINKQYRLGTVGTGTLSHDLNRFWHKIRGKEDPYLKVGTVNDRSKKASSDYVWALRDINFEVKRGEILGIIGKNGAGKSTLLKILSRVTAPTTGSIKTKGRIASLLEVGTGMHPELTGRENIYLNGAILGMTKAEIASKLEEIVDFSGCEMYIDTPVKRYSSGMRVRLGFAVAAFLEPDILVVDEVLAVGDAEFQKKAIGKMQDISNTTGRTVLFVSHNMAAVKDLCTKAIVLNNGEAIYEGTTFDAVDSYLKNAKTQKEIGSSTFIKLKEYSSKINHGEDITLKLSLNFKNCELITLGYVIKDEMDNVVCCANMHQQGLKYKKNTDEHVTITVKNVSCVPGVYYLDMYIGNGTFDVETIYNFLEFEILWPYDLALPKDHWGNSFYLTKWR